MGAARLDQAIVIIKAQNSFVGFVLFFFTFFTLLPVIKLIKDHWHGSRHISVIINETYKFNLQSS
jgi:hypothetical protein